MTDRELLIELLAIKLFEHIPLASGERHRMSWTEASAEGRQDYRDMIVDAANTAELYEQLAEASGQD